MQSQPQISQLSPSDVIVLAQRTGVPTHRIQRYFDAKSQNGNAGDFALAAAIDMCGISTYGLLHKKIPPQQAVATMHEMVAAMRVVPKQEFASWYIQRTFSDLAIPRDLAILSQHTGRLTDGVLHEFRVLMRERTGAQKADPVAEELQSQIRS